MPAIMFVHAGGREMCELNQSVSLSGVIRFPPPSLLTYRLKHCGSFNSPCQAFPSLSDVIYFQG